MTPEEEESINRRRYQIANEILVTEKFYVSALDIVVDVCLYFFFFFFLSPASLFLILSRVQAVRRAMAARSRNLQEAAGSHRGNAVVFLNIINRPCDSLQDIQKIFAGWEAIRRVNRKFLSQLEPMLARWKADTRLGELLYTFVRSHPRSLSLSCLSCLYSSLLPMD
jgi:hypothetical protein